MNTNTQIDKIDKVLSKISGKEMKAFVRQYATVHEDFATALVEKYWKPERGNNKEQVEVTKAADMVRELLIKNDEIEEESRMGMLGEIAEQCEEITA